MEVIRVVDVVDGGICECLSEVRWWGLAEKREEGFGESSFYVQRLL